tara:strand:- start:8 stop:433 length:426 start_codon:yes stop_codon:yes gene_type:complete
MKVILKKTVKKVGQAGEMVEVKDGYAQGFLLPQDLAVIATESEIKKLNQKRASVAEKQELTQKQHKELFKKVQGQVFETSKRANSKGVLFAAIDRRELSEISGLDQEFIATEQPIKDAGEHVVEIKVGEFSGAFTLMVLPQ